jgi:hypothetical protein
MIEKEYETMIGLGCFTTHDQLMEHKAKVHELIAQCVAEYGFPREFTDESTDQICDIFMLIAEDYVDIDSAFIVMIDYPINVEHKFSREGLKELPKEKYEQAIDVIAEYIRETFQVSVHFRELESPMLELYQIGHGLDAATLTFMDKVMNHNPLAVQIDSDEKSAGFIFNDKQLR